MRQWCVGVLLGLLCGCSTMVAKRITDFDSVTLAPSQRQELAQQGFNDGRFCLQGRCLHYLTGKPLHSTRLRSSLQIDGHESQLLLSRDQLPRRVGTVVLLHGFRMTKELMSANGLYWRFLGYRVLIPDLPGHGGSHSDFSFGTQDGRLLSAWLDDQSQLTYPLYLFGNSMGAVAAAHLAAARNDVSGLILQAPMLGLEQSVLNFPRPWYLGWIPDDSMRQGARQALTTLSLQESQLDIRQLLPELALPTLIFASDGDAVSPYAELQPLRSNRIKVVNVPNLTHPQLALIGNAEHRQIQAWLQQRQHENRRPPGRGAG
ncbi:MULTISPECIES: alpha/beta hydrolase [Ferrimonas]|uniref:alpha/beta hydrolase n=1 Tax=Ferrimonas TaxID=44011 RepID=UPI00041ACFFC|nr:MULTISPECIES: alpha/beta fold hydrolase [Ferrimonas]USD37783.1 alpha/beta fold hydrolase [Ferrimonas sp. SCSIO 43195]